MTYTWTLNEKERIEFAISRINTAVEVLVEAMEDGPCQHELLVNFLKDTARILAQGNLAQEPTTKETK